MADSSMKEEDPINDAFNSIVMAEERFKQEGFKEGFADGQIQGRADGLRLGAENGAKMGMEIGYYNGFATTWLHLLNGETEDEQKASSKTRQALQQFIELLELFTADKPENFDLEKLAKVRAKFKQVESLLDTCPDYSATAKLTF